MDLLQYTFFQHALLGSLLASIACGIIGTYIVTRRLVFISGGITHASFGGIGLGLFAGISPILSAAVFSVLSAFGVEWLSRRKDMREDSAIAVFWTLGMALGIMFSFLSPGFAPDLSAYLFGNILTINQADLWMLGILAFILTGFFYLFIRPIVSIAFDREFARSQKIPVEVFEYVLMMFIALTIVACLRMVGIASCSPTLIWRATCCLPIFISGHRSGHFTAHHSANDGKPLHVQFQKNHLAVHRYRFSGMSGRSVYLLSLESSFGSLDYILLHPDLCRLQDRKELLQETVIIIE